MQLLWLWWLLLFFLVALLLVRCICVDLPICIAFLTHWCLVEGRASRLICIFSNYGFQAIALLREERRLHDVRVLRLISWLLIGG